MDKTLTADFKNPPSVYRGKPFWAWNGKLAPEELKRQIHIMKRMGLGGFFMHARVGLDTPYLEKEWFECIDTCMAEAKKLGMEAWIYDEDRWSSGAAGGLVTKNKQFRMRRLYVKVHTSPKTFSWNKDVAAAYCVSLDAGAMTTFSRLAKGQKPKTLAFDQSILSFVNVIDGDDDWYNGQAYLDTMNPEAVDVFIKTTHEAYRKRYGKEFGKLIPGIFTDEPNHGEILAGWEQTKTTLGVIPWTLRLPAVFKERYGYDVLDHLPTLVYDSKAKAGNQPRYHYHDCTTFLFVNSFAKRIGTWCKKNNIMFTGHVLEEDWLSTQTGKVGSAMRFYEYMQLPGMDLLTERWNVFDTAKQVSSMAHQFGAKWRLTETYGCTGWDFSFAGHKALSDWQVALGINLRCQHLSWYTMLGEAKRDYPAGIFYQSPWWQLYTKVEDYFGRIHAVMTRGQEVRDLLVIHPVESMWLKCKVNWKSDQAVLNLDRMLLELRDTLLCGHCDFDYGEEEVLSRHAKVIAGKNSPKFVVNKARYKAVLVPPMLTIRGTTLELLRKFKAAGGLVIFSGEVPVLVDALVSDAARTFAKRCVQAPHNGAGLVSSVEPTRRISIQDENGKEVAPAFYLLREDKDAFYLFICNTSLSQSQMSYAVRDTIMVRERKEAFTKVTVTGFAECNGDPLELDPDTGNTFKANADKEISGWKIKTDLPALGSRLFIISKQTGKSNFPVRKQYSTVRTEPLSPAKWSVQLSECNNLVLDRPSYKINAKAGTAPEEILRLDRKIRDTLKIKHRGGAMKQPWAQEPVKNPRSIPVELSYDFTAHALPGGDLFLALEQPQVFTIAVNGVNIDTNVECGWWVDTSLRKIPVDCALIRLGKNTITLKLNYCQTFSGLEIIYLLGNFGTVVQGTEVAVTAPVNTLKIGDWTGQGLAFYSGSAAYRTTITNNLIEAERMVVAVPEYCGTALRVLVNGVSAGIIAWEPNELDITDFLTQGSNALAIEVVGHRRNSHGPHHHKEKWPVWTGPGEFVAGPDTWFEGYNLVPCGMLAAPEIIIKKEKGQV